MWAIGIAGSSTCSGCAHKSMLKSNSTRSFICPLRLPAHHFRSDRGRQCGCHGNGQRRRCRRLRHCHRLAECDLPSPRAGQARAECRQRAALSLRALTERSYLTWGPSKMAAVKSVRIKNKFAALQATSISVSLQSPSLLLPRLVNFPCPHNILFKYFQ